MPSEQALFTLKADKSELNPAADTAYFANNFPTFIANFFHVDSDISSPYILAVSAVLSLFKSASLLGMAKNRTLGHFAKLGLSLLKLSVAGLNLLWYLGKSMLSGVAAAVIGAAVPYVLTLYLSISLVSRLIQLCLNSVRYFKTRHTDPKQAEKYLNQVKHHAFASGIILILTATCAIGCIFKIAPLLMAKIGFAVGLIGMSVSIANSILPKLLQRYPKGAQRVQDFWQTIKKYVAISPTSDNATATAPAKTLTTSTIAITQQLGQQHKQALHLYGYKDYPATVTEIEVLKQAIREKIATLDDEIQQANLVSKLFRNTDRIGKRFILQQMLAEIEKPKPNLAVLYQDPEFKAQVASVFKSLHYKISDTSALCHAAETYLQTAPKVS